MSDFGKGLPNCPDLAALATTELVERLRSRQSEMVTLCTTGLHVAHEMGEILCVIKKRRDEYETWGVWLKQNFPGSRKTAGNYQRIARKWPLLEKHLKKNPRFGIFEALEILREREKKQTSPANAGTANCKALQKQISSAVRDDMKTLSEERLEFIHKLREFDGKLIDMNLGSTIAVDYIQARKAFDSETHKLFDGEPPARTDPRLSACQMKFRIAIEKLLETPKLTEREREFLGSQLPVLPESAVMESAA